MAPNTLAVWSLVLLPYAVFGLWTDAQWQLVPTSANANRMPTPNQGFMSAFWRGTSPARRYVVAVGGQYDGWASAARYAWVLNLDTHTWIGVNDDAIETGSRREGAVFTYGDNLWLVGGRNQSGWPQHFVMILGLKNLKWQNNNFSTTNAPSPRYGHSLVVDADAGQAYLFGGYDGDGYLDDLHVLNIASKSWSAVTMDGDTPAASAFHASYFDPQQGAFYVFGGETTGPTSLNAMWKFTIDGSPTDVVVESLEDGPYEEGSRSLMFPFDDDLVVLQGINASSASSNDLPNVFAFDGSEWTEPQNSRAMPFSVRDAYRRGIGYEQPSSKKKRHPLEDGEEPFSWNAERAATEAGIYVIGARNAGDAAEPVVWRIVRHGAGDTNPYDTAVMVQTDAPSLKYLLAFPDEAPSYYLVEKGSSVKTQVVFSKLREVTSSNTLVREEDFPSENYLVSALTAGDVQTFSFLHVSEGFEIEMSIKVSSKAQSFAFGGVGFSVPKESPKVSLKISGWDLGASNHLQLITDVHTFPDPVDFVTERSGSIESNYLVLDDDSVVRLRSVLRAVVDGQTAGTSMGQSTFAPKGLDGYEWTIDLPAFTQSVEIDPDSAFVSINSVPGYGDGGGDGDGDSGALGALALLAVVPCCCLAAVVGAAVAVVYVRRRRAKSELMGEDGERDSDEEEDEEMGSVASSSSSSAEAGLPETTSQDKLIPKADAIHTKKPKKPASSSSHSSNRTDNSGQYLARGGASGATTIGDSDDEDGLRSSCLTATATTFGEGQYRELHWEDLEVDMSKPLGRGSFGKVYRGKWRETEVAVKVFDSDFVDESVAEEIRKEARMMQRVGHHPHVVRFIGAITRGDRFCLVTQLAPLGSLHALLKRPDVHIPHEIIVRMARDVASAMVHLHRENVIHRDLACRNLLLGDNYHVYVADFGLSRIAQSATLNVTASNIGPVRWMAPEALVNREYSEASDVYSFGVTFWEMLSRQEPWSNLEPAQVVLEVVNAGKRLEIPAEWPSELRDIIAACFRTQTEERPSFKEITRALDAYLSATPSSASSLTDGSATTTKKRRKAGKVRAKSGRDEGDSDEMSDVSDKEYNARV